jgi:hypothetical protein
MEGGWRRGIGAIFFEGGEEQDGEEDSEYMASVELRRPASEGGPYWLGLRVGLGEERAHRNAGPLVACWKQALLWDCGEEGGVKPPLR